MPVSRCDSVAGGGVGPLAGVGLSCSLDRILAKMLHSVVVAPALGAGWSATAGRSPRGASFHSPGSAI
eukprot:843117-Pyramimonas_sp.AAC.1